MPNSHGIHPDAQAEYDDIQQRGNLTQQVASTGAWIAAMLAVRRGSVNGLRRGAVFPKGPVYVAEQSVPSMFGGGTKAAAVVAVSSAARDVELLACDVADSPWWHGSSPEVRAGWRMT